MFPIWNKPIKGIYLRTIKQNGIMTTTKKIIAFTDSVNECDCCGKSGLKGTFCVSIDGNEFYYGSTCAFKKHGFEKSESKLALNAFDKLVYAKRQGFSSLEEKYAYQEMNSKRIQEWANNIHL